MLPCRSHISLADEVSKQQVPSGLVRRELRSRIVQRANGSLSNGPMKPQERKPNLPAMDVLSIVDKMRIPPEAPMERQVRE